MKIKEIFQKVVKTLSNEKTPFLRVKINDNFFLILQLKQAGFKYKEITNEAGINYASFISIMKEVNDKNYLIYCDYLKIESKHKSSKIKYKNIKAERLEEIIKKSLGEN